MITILIPTDFSENAKHAIKYALELYKCERADFYFMHAFADEVYALGTVKNAELLNKAKKDIQKKTEASLLELAAWVKEFSPNPRHTYKTVAIFEPLVDAINDFVNQKNIDLVIMGTKGKSNDKKIAFGSHTVQTFKYVQCPVLAIPQSYDYQQPKKILFPTDYLLPYKRRELKLLNKLAGAFKSEIHCLHISKYEKLSLRQEDNKLFLEGSLDKASLFFERTHGKDKVKTFLEHITNKEINMLVLINSRRSFLEDLLYRATVDKIGLTIKIPFLVMQNLPR